MTHLLDTEVKKNLRKAFDEQRITLFLGAGVSVANGLPMWDKLVLSIYFATISEQRMDGWRPFSNYLYAISEWYLSHTNDSLEITARKVRSFYDNDPDGLIAFTEAVREAIYGVDTHMNPASLLNANATLKSVVDICKAKKNNSRYGVKSVITYNYDNLVEMTLKGKRPAKPIYSDKCVIKDDLSIFHVHGYVPLKPPQDSPDPGEIVFTEEQYNFASLDPYSWSNVVQLREMSSSVGIMIGLSLADRNIRRLLDALSRSPLKPEIYALLEKPKTIEVSDEDTEFVHNEAIRIYEKFENSGIKKSYSRSEEQSGFERKQKHSTSIKVSGVKSSGQPRPGIKSGRKGEKTYRHQIREIINQVDILEQQQQEQILGDLGITPIWYNNHGEIPEILSQIYQ